MVPLVFYKIIVIFIFLQQVCDSSSHLSDQHFFGRFFCCDFRLSFRLTSGFQSKLLLFSQKNSVKERGSRISPGSELTQEEFPVSQGSVGAEWRRVRVAWAAVAITRVRQRVSAAPQWPHSPGRSSRYPNTSVAVGRDNNRLYDQI